MGRYLRCYAITALVFLGLDGVWLSIIGPAYRRALGELMRADPLWTVAGLFYAGFVIGLLVFAVYPARSFTGAAGRGGLFGLFTYATFEMTNLALLAGWPAWLTLVDTLWGTAACAAAATVGYAVR